MVEKYPAPLGQPQTQNEKLVRILVDGESEYETDILNQLLKHYKIDNADPSRWFWLAISLARSHVPALQTTSKKKVGRPKKSLTKVAEADGVVSPKRKRGAPKVITEKDLTATLELVKFFKGELESARALLPVNAPTRRAVAETLSELGGRKITDKAAIAALLRECSSLRSEAFLNNRKSIPTLQKRLAEARKQAKK